MKVAMCLSGLSSGLNYKHGGLPVSFESEALNYKKYFTDKHNADVFFHSWSSEHENEIINAYNPCDYIFEDKKVLKNPTIYDFIYNLYSLLFGGKDKVELHRLNNIYSRWYSLYKSVTLLENYQIKHSIEYDFVLLTRFDLTILSLFDCSELNQNEFYVGDWLGFKNETGLIIPEQDVVNNLSSNSFHRGYPNNNSILDFWFLSSSKNIVKFSKLFLEIDRLVNKFGPNNHILAYEYILECGMADTLSLYKKQFHDFNLTRWL